MAHIFDVTAAEDWVYPSSSGTGEISFTVTNVSASAVSGRAVLRPENSPVLPWLKVMGEQERLLQPNQRDTFLVKVAIPPGTSAGDYTFRLDIVSVARPYEDSTQGPPIKIPVTLAPKPSKPFPKWILVVAAVVIGGLGLAALKLIPASKVTVPDLHGLTVKQADALLTPLHLKRGTRTEAPADKADVDHIIAQTPEYDPKNPAQLAPDSLVDITVGIAKPEPTPAPAPVAQAPPEPAPIDNHLVVVPRIVNFTFHDAVITVAKTGLVPIIHFVRARSNPAPDIIEGQFPPEDTKVEMGTAVLITTAIDDPAKVGTFLKLPITGGNPEEIDGDVARRMAGVPERPRRVP